MKKILYFLMAGILSVMALTGCGADRDNAGEDLQRLAQIEVYSSDGNLINTITDEDILEQFNSLNFIDISSDTDSEQDGLESETDKLTVLYTIVSYKEPAAVHNNGALEKLMEITVYEDSNIVREQVVQESIKGSYIPEEYLVFYSMVSDEDKNFILSLTEFNK